MRLLGAVIAGGASRRFGSDKARALLSGRALLDHVADGLTAQTDAVIVVGREWPGRASVPDRPYPGLGPLGGLCGALAYAEAQGFDAVLTAGCDVLPVPVDLQTKLSSGPAVVAGQPLFGLWPTALCGSLDDYLACGGDRSQRGWAAHCQAREAILATPLHNFNTPADLALYMSLEGSAA